MAVDLTRIVHGEHTDPHTHLGLHDGVIRLYRPGAHELYLEVKGEIYPARKTHPSGLFELEVPTDTSFLDYRIYHQNGLLAHDPYAFLPTWGEVDGHLFNKGTHYKLYEKMGARVMTHQGVQGVSFTVWAPNAARVSVVGDFNVWDGRVNAMRRLGTTGVWELFVPGLEFGERYKFEIKTEQGEILVKADPYAYASEVRPMTASVVADLDSFEWSDHAWIEERERTYEDPKPLNIYEVHLGSWKLSHGHHKNYRALAAELAAYCKEMGYTHVELMPVMEHPLDESWGYQVSGFYAVTSRYGTPADFQFFVNHMHEQGIGVLLDWVPGHFPSDGFSLASFDGTCLYEHEDPRQGYHPHWNTLIFNYGRYEVSNFLLGSALFWLDKLHIDGFRVDAVASMLYLDYGRDDGGWIPNEHGGKENLEAIEFIKHLNSIIHKRFAGVITIAEESTSFPGVTGSVEWDGLGFDYKWNMGWMNDALRYTHRDFSFRSSHQKDLTFGLTYAFSEKFMLPFSHDEVVHGKGSLLSKMPGEYAQKFAGLRLLLSYQMCQPGKKLLFMGAEIGQFGEWAVKEELDWHLLQYPIHGALKRMVKELNHFYLGAPQLWENDSDFGGFEWVDFSDSDNCVISYLRKGSSNEQLLCVHNFSANAHSKYLLPVTDVTSLQEVFNSDREEYGGSGALNEEIEIEDSGIHLQLAPLSTMIFSIKR